MELSAISIPTVMYSSPDRLHKNSVHLPLSSLGPAETTASKAEFISENSHLVSGKQDYIANQLRLLTRSSISYFLIVLDFAAVAI